MDFDFYRNFITIAETGNLTTAAKKLSLAQPALSAQVKTMEQYYNIKLLKTGRGMRQAELTEAGEAFLRKAKKICMLEENLFTEMNNYQEGSAGSLTFSISPGVTDFFMHRYLLPFSLQYPDVIYEVHEVDVQTQMKHISEGLADFAFANAPLAKKSLFKTCSSEKEYFYVVYTEDNKIAFAPPKELKLTELIGVPLCCNFGCYRLLANACAGAGFAPVMLFTSTTARAALTFAATGSAAAVVSGSCLHSLPQGMLYRRIDEEALFFEQMLFWEKGITLSACADKFLDFYLQSNSVK